MFFNLNKRLIALIIAIIGGILLLIFRFGLGVSDQQLNKQSSFASQDNQPPFSQDQNPKILSTNPDLSNNPVISPTQVIEINFNKPLLNAPETKIRFDPELKYKIELSDDKKVAKISPIETFGLGQGYTLFILSSTKLENGSELGKEYHYNFQTIEYKGI